MSDFYSKWLGYWKEEKEEKRKSRISISEEDLQWVRTVQDREAALICDRSIGFFTAGNAMVARIPKGWHTGKHSHGEEAIYIVGGSGFSVVDDKRYDWDDSSCLFMPFGSVHQHFNTGDKEVKYYSVMGLELERFAGLAKIVQYEEAGETPMGVIEGIEKAESEVHPEYGRIVLRFKDSIVVQAKDQAAKAAARTDEFALSQAKETKVAGAKGHHSRVINFMVPEAGFKTREVEMTGFLCDAAGMPTGRHGHMEAVIYVVQGEGHSILDGERIDWKKGSLIHVQGPQTVHQHFNTGKVESLLLRTHFGLRAHYYQPIAKRVFPYLYFEYSRYE